MLEQRDANSLWKQLKRWLSLLLACAPEGTGLRCTLDGTVPLLLDLLGGLHGDAPGLSADEVAALITLISTTATVIYFKRKGWL